MDGPLKEKYEFSLAIVGRGFTFHLLYFSYDTTA
jgi:hypothetical protein